MRLEPASACLVATLLLPAAAGAWPMDFNHPKVQAGNDAYRRGDFEAAGRAYEAAWAELPDSPELHYNLGDAYMKLGRTEEARRVYEVALRKGAGSFKAGTYFNLGNAFVTLNQKDDAITAYRQALKLDPGFEPARHNLEVLLREKQQAANAADTGAADSGREEKPDAACDAGRSRSSPDAGLGDAGGTEDGGRSRRDGGSGDGGRDGGSPGASDGSSPAPPGPGPSDAGADGGQSFRPSPRDKPPVDFRPRSDAGIGASGRPEKDW